MASGGENYCRASHLSVIVVMGSVTKGEKYSHVHNPLSEYFMKTYNRKVWGVPLETMNKAWITERKNGAAG